MIKLNSVITAILALLLPFRCFSQMVLSSGTTLSKSGTPIVVVQTAGNFTNNTTFDFSQLDLRLLLTGLNQNLNGNVNPTLIKVEGGGTKTVNGTLTVSNSIQFNSGLLKPGTGKIIYTGSSEGLLNASSTSYVDGLFYTNASGLLYFPVGANGLGYMPSYIVTGSGKEVGMSVTNAGANLTPDANSPELTSINNTYYWTVQTANINDFNSNIVLTLSEPLPVDLAPVVVEAAELNGLATSLGSLSSNENSVTSAQPFSKKYFTVGASTSVDIKIHDLITPFRDDGLNDQLSIEYIAKFSTNRVTLLDRWGVVVKEWNNFTNFNDPVNPNQDLFDFTKLSPGNYICIVEYGSEGKMNRKKSQMITVLKL